MQYLWNSKLKWMKYQDTTVIFGEMILGCVGVEDSNMKHDLHKKTRTSTIHIIREIGYKRQKTTLMDIAGHILHFSMHKNQIDSI